MKKILCVLTVFCIMAAPAYAGSLKHITLSDGSTLKGKIIDYDNGIYTIKTNNLGLIKINEEKVESISSKAAAQQQAQQIQRVPQIQGAASGLSGMGGSGNGKIMEQAQALQGQLMANPQMMQEVQELMNDPDIMEMMSDQNFINAVMSGDMNRLMNDPKMQQLMNNPAMQDFVNKLQAQGMTPQGMGY
jgi:hypothetical protein